MFDLVAYAKSKGKKYAEQIVSSSGIAVFVSQIKRLNIGLWCRAAASSLPCGRDSATRYCQGLLTPYSTQRPFETVTV